MAKNVYALLIGIDKYHPDSIVNPLYGCVNDIKAMEAYLRKRIATDKEWQLVENSAVPWLLTNELATRQAIINGFQQHLCKADSEDVVLFYFAGHGSQESAPPEFWDEKPNHLMENLVCYDSRTKNGLHLADKELNYLIFQVAKNNPHIAVILDCCHSGTATRDPAVTVRQAPINTRQRNLKDFIFPEQWVRDRSNANDKSARHVAIAACFSHQTAKEYTDKQGQPRGAFSYFLTETLQSANGSLSYSDLVNNIRALVSSKIQEQSPQIEATEIEDLNKAFLGGAVGDHNSYFNLTYNSAKYDSWVINAGALHGIPTPSNEEDVLLAIFPENTSFEKLRQLSNAICRAKLTQILPEFSTVEIIDNQTHLLTEKAYFAVITSLPLPQLKVYFQGEMIGVELARQALSTASYDDKHSLFVQEVAELVDANYCIDATEGQYWIKKASDKHPLVAPVPDIPDSDSYTPKRAHQVIQRLENIARWQNILDLKSQPTSQIQPDDVEMEVIISSGGKEISSKQVTSEMCGKYTYKNGKWLVPTIQIKVTNNSEQDFYFQIVELAGDYEVCVPPFFFERSSLFLPRKSKLGAVVESRKVPYGIPKKFLAKAITEYKEIFKLIVSTSDFDAGLLKQPGLDAPLPKTRSTGEIKGSLNRLMDRVHSRQIYRRQASMDDTDESNDNWMTKEVYVTLVKPH